MRKLCESKDLAAEFRGVDMTFQILDVKTYGEADKPKSINSKVMLSDGQSKVICMVPDKTHTSMVSLINIGFFANFVNIL